MSLLYHMIDILKTKKIYQNGGKLFYSYINSHHILFFSMGSKITDVDKRVSPGPSVYDLPSKIIEKQGKTFGIKIHNLKDVTNAPGPGAYS